MKLQEVQISKIKITENHRVNIERTNLDEMMQSIKQHGLIQPIGVAVKGNKYILRFGQRRLIACKKLGYKTVSAMVVGEIKNEKLLLENLTENIQRNDPSFGEIGRIIHKLEKDGLDLQQIAVRLGITFRKVKQVYDVYAEFPEKYRDRVLFMEPGKGRLKGKSNKIPAQIATKIINMKRHHGLNEKAMEQIFDTVSKDKIDAADLGNVGNLIASGMSTEEALNNIRDYGVFSFEVVVKHTEIQDLMAKHGLISKKHLFKKIIYGEVPPLNKPSFVETGIVITKIPEKKKEEQAEKKSIWKIRIKLMDLIKEGKLSDTQKDALKPTANVPVKKWSEEQRDQIKDIYERVTRNESC